MRLSNGDIRNSYAVKILNKRQTGQRLQLAVEGLPAATLGFVGAGIEGAGSATRLIVHPDAVGTFRVFLTVPANAAPAGSSAIEFAIRDESGRQRASHDAVFFGPTR